MCLRRPADAGVAGVAPVGGLVGGLGGCECGCGCVCVWVVEWVWMWVRVWVCLRHSIDVDVAGVAPVGGWVGVGVGVGVCLGVLAQLRASRHGWYIVCGSKFKCGYALWGGYDCRLLKIIGLFCRI